MQMARDIVVTAEAESVQNQLAIARMVSVIVPTFVEAVEVLSSIISE